MGGIFGLRLSFDQCDKSKHSTEKSFACEYCNYSSQQKSALKKHYESRHSTINIE